MEQLADHKRELSTIHEDLISLDLENDHELVTQHVALERLQFECSHKIRKLMSTISKTNAPVADGKGVRLPRLDVPTFGGDVLHWSQFWEQFKISVHDRPHLSDSEKLVYLQQAVKNGSAKPVIEELSHSGENYNEAIDCLKSRFNRPRLLHHAHVRKIVEAPSLKDGSGKELRRLHDTVQQHKKPPTKKPFTPVTTFTANSESMGNCILCNAERHPLYVCPKFKVMSHSNKMSTLWKSNFCINCLNGRHTVKDCKSSHRCKRCQRPHHTLLYVGSNHSNTSAPAPPTSLQVSANSAIKIQSSSLLMTCRVLIKARGGSFVEGRALLDNASSASFISECLAQNLQLLRSPQTIHIFGIAGSSSRSPIQSVASLRITPLYGDSTKQIDLTAIVLPKVTCDLPVSLVPFDSSWSHISDLPLGDPAFGLPGRIDLLLGVDVFVSVLRQGRRKGPPGAPIALETEFGYRFSVATLNQSWRQNKSTSM